MRLSAPHNLWAEQIQFAFADICLNHGDTVFQMLLPRFDAGNSATDSDRGRATVIL